MPAKNDYARGIVNRSLARVMFLASKSHRRTRQFLCAVITRQSQAAAAGTVRINNYQFGKKSVKIKNTFKFRVFFFFFFFIRYIKQILTAFYSGHSLKL